MPRHIKHDYSQQPTPQQMPQHLPNLPQQLPQQLPQMKAIPSNIPPQNISKKSWMLGILVLLILAMIAIYLFYFKNKSNHPSNYFY